MRQRNDTVYYWDREEGKAKKARVERYSTKAPGNILLQSGGYVHCAELFNERSQAEKFGKKAKLALASGGGEETAQAVTQQLALASGGEEEIAATTPVASDASVKAEQEGELAPGSLGNETKEEKEDELASGSRALEKGKTDPTSGSLGKEAEVEEAKEEKGG